MRLRNRTLEIDLVLPSFAARDAIGYHTLKLQELIRSLGIGSEIYADEIKGELRGLARPVGALTHQGHHPSRYIVYQASTGSPVVRSLMNRKEPLLINFHNITPKDILGRWDIGVGMVVGAGLKQLSVLKERISGAISVSEYNRWCLKQEGITQNSLVASPFIPISRHLVTRSQYSPLKEGKSGSRWLFVGRVAPNKAQHDIVKAFSAYLKGWDSSAKLTLVGPVSSQSYADSLKELIKELDLEDRVHVTGPVDNAALEEQYGRATVFVCLSDHEGFGFPVIEALSHSLPVVAFASTAVPETLGDAGVLLSSKEPLHVAAAVALIESGPTLREQLRTNARDTLVRYSPEAARRENLSALQALVPEMANYL
jgi:glycosyltransferase involved in cell wall biosynthesis